MTSEPKPKRLIVTFFALEIRRCLDVGAHDEKRLETIDRHGDDLKAMTAKARLSIAGVSKPAIPMSPDDSVCAIKLPLER